MTNNTSTERLLPCPFCAAQAKSWCAYPDDGDRAAFYIECDDCDARTCAWWTEAEAVAAWNRRSTPETERLRSALNDARAYVALFDGPRANEVLTTIDSLLTPTRDPR